MMLYAAPPRRPWRVRLLGLAIVGLLCWQLALSLPGAVHPSHKAPPRPPAVAVTVGGRTYACTVASPAGPLPGPAPSRPYMAKLRWI
jgi:hypothetical protein